MNRPRYQIINADILEWASGYTGEPFMACLCDPPYHLTSITARFSGKNSKPPKHGKDGSFKRLSTGFMQSTWDGLGPDGKGIAFNPETWTKILSHLYPGAFAMAFASSRGYHRMAVAIEDGGAIFHPSVFMFGYGFGSGFPKATRIDTQIDSANGLERPDKVKGGHIGMGRYAGDADNENELENRVPHTVGKGNHTNGTPVHPLAKTWAGHRYGLQCLKPAIEPLLTFSKRLNYEPIYDAIAQDTFFVEAICSFLSVPDVEVLMSQVHQLHRGVVEDFAHANVDTWELLKSVKFVGVSSESNLASLTMRDFVVGNVPTKDAMLHLVRTILIGQGESLLAKATPMSESEEGILLSIGLLWRNILGELSNRGSTFIISTATSLITDLKILNSYLCQITLGIITKEDKSGYLSLVPIVEILLKSLWVKLQSLSSITAIDGATKKLAEGETGQEESNLSLEPILLFQRPYSQRPIDDITQTGAGALNIDGGRVGANGNDLEKMDRHKNPTRTGWAYNGSPDSKYTPSSNGRWPANLLLQHNPDCQRVGVKRVKGSYLDHECKGSDFFSGLDTAHNNGYADPDGYETVEDWQCSEGCPARMLGEQSGQSTSRANLVSDGRSTAFYVAGNIEDGGVSGERSPENSYSDSGTAARFFYQSDWSYDIAEQLANANPLYYTAKPGRTEREAGLENLPVKTRHRVNSGGLENEPRFAPTQVRNNHPTVKPISLTKYLATLLLPPAAYAPRRILIPFGGVGSEAIGAMLAGFEEIVIVEQDASYCEIAEARLAWWSDRMRFGATDPDVILDSLKQETNPDQLTFF